jgi:predicted nucleic acid-binding protein
VIEASHYLLDTTALIDFSKGFEPARSNILSLLDVGKTLAVCSVTVAEFYTGLKAPQRQGWDRLFHALPYWDIGIEAAMQAGIWRSEFSQKGIRLSTTDALVAATAWEHAAVLVTNNIKHYPMTEIQVMSARD